MPQNWKTYRLEDALESLIDYRGKTPKKTTSGIPLVTAKIVKRGVIQEPKEFIAISDYDRWMVRGFPEIGDVVLTTEAPLGEVALIKDKNIALAQRIITLRGEKGKLSSTFLKYFLQSTVGQNRLIARESGTTVTGIKQSELRKVLIDCPYYEEQTAIASILSTIDAKIENNLAINKTLEEMAMALYKEWFVDFGPFQDGKFVESELGMIPEGWEVKKIKMFGKVITGKTPSKKDKENYIDGIYPFIKIPDMHNNSWILETSEYLSVSGHEKQVNKLLPSGSIIVSCIATVGLVSINIVPSHTNQQINAITPTTKNSSYYLFLSMKCLEQKFLNLASGGSTTLNMNKSTFSDVDVIKPTEEILDNFHKLVTSQFEKIRENTIQNKTLTTLRDTLLPKLISGEVRLNEFANT